jgi:hypothetical protein
MQQNRTENRPFAWTPARKTALQLLVEDQLTDEAIARQVGVCRRTLGYWKAHPDFIAAADRLVEEYRAELRRESFRRFRLEATYWGNPHNAYTRKKGETL